MSHRDETDTRRKWQRPRACHMVEGGELGVAIQFPQTPGGLPGAAAYLSQDEALGFLVEFARVVGAKVVL